MDAYGEAEQATAFPTVLEEHLAIPFGATVLDELKILRSVRTQLGKDAARALTDQRWTEMKGRTQFERSRGYEGRQRDQAA